MMSLQELAQEYIESAAKLTSRLAQLEQECSTSVGLERARLNERIAMLRTMECQTLETAHELMRYYEEQPRRVVPRAKY